MADKRKILAIIDFEDSPDTVMERAAWIAKIANCDLEIALCDSSASPIGHRFLLSHEAEEISIKVKQIQDEVIGGLARIAEKSGVTVTTVILEERPIADAVLAHAIEINPYLIIKGTHYHSASVRGIMVDTDWQLMRTCPYPLWLVKRGEFGEHPLIVAAVDPTHGRDKPVLLDQKIIDTAKSIAESADGELHLFHSYQSLQGIGIAANKTFKPEILAIDEIDQRVRKEHLDTLEALASRNGIDKAHTHQLPGRTRDLLPIFVRNKKASLIVMGALARWGIKRMVIGSTAERVLDHLPCDLLIVRLDDDG